MTQHLPADACQAVHCYYHNEDEEDREDDFRACGECFHIFRTAAELLTAHNQVLAALAADPYRMLGDPLFGGSRPMLLLETDADKVFCCPLCSHDW